MADETPKPEAPLPPPRGFDGFEMTFVCERLPAPSQSIPAPMARRSLWPWILAALAMLLVVAVLIVLL